MNQLLVRSISGAIFVLLVVLAILTSSWATAGVFFLLVAGGLSEYYKLLNLKSFAFPLLSGLILFVLIGLWILGEIEPVYLISLGLLPVLLLSADLFRKKKSPASGFTFASWLYVLPAFILALYMRADPGQDGAILLISFFILLWSNDSGAYAWGKMLGKHKLLPSVSPGKTWEGCIGGGLTAIVAAVLIDIWLYDSIGMHDWVIAAILTSVFSTIGDLYESLLKRTAGVKDSGRIMPGHGGVLDRFDGMLFALPVVFVYFYVFSSFI